jgi:epoxyqueuosine reductase
MLNKAKNTSIIKKKAYELGFDFVGVSKSKFLKEDSKKLEEWLTKGLHGKLSYMENHFDKRCDPSKLVEGSKSVVSLLYNYHTKKRQLDTEAPKISRYAFGEDYHFVVREKLNELFNFIKTEIGEVEGRSFVDSAPVLERALARESGLGWTGKHGLLINKQQGSEFFIAELILDLELEVDSPIKDYCGTCTACVDDCPTDAILPNKVLNASKCISYLTIELKEEILPVEFKGKMDNWMFGCDICQDVCPWNRFSVPNNESQFSPVFELLEITKQDWDGLTQEKFKTLFKKSAIKRTKFSGLKRNIDFLKP